MAMRLIKARIFRWWDQCAAHPTAHDTIGGIHGHSDRGAAPDPTDAATDRPAAEPEATSWG
jgi:hypothetical protein